MCSSDLCLRSRRRGRRHRADVHVGGIDALSVDAPSETLQLTLVTDRETLRAWYDIVLACFPTTFSAAYFEALAATSLSPDAAWQHYVARVEGEVVTASSIYLGAGVAGLYNLGTRPDRRRQGIGAWMTRATFQAARAQGYHVATLQTTYPNALRMYHRMGFEVYGKISIYDFVPTKERSGPTEP